MATKCPKCQSENPETLKFCGECGTRLPTSKGIHPEVTETLQVPIQELTTGSTFAGRYQIIEELGKGGMGRVYKVFDTDIKEKVALKLLKPEIASDRDTIERFSNELRFARKISHRNVCRMYDLSKAEGTHFITMEYVPGQDLRGLIRQSKQLTVGTAVAIAKQVCEGLAEAHRLGIVHRDLKPSNIIIDKDGNAKIMDFGIARSIWVKGITGAGLMIGTPEYMSPEQVEGKEADQRSDIYSLGIILYEMLTGQVPFEGDTPYAVGLKHKSEMPRNPRDLNPQVPEDLSRLILKCLEKARENRYQSAEEVGAEIEKTKLGIPLTEKIISRRKPLTSRQITVTFGLKKLFIPAVVLTALVIAVFLILKYFPRKVTVPPGASLDPNKVVVAIFENRTGDSAVDNLGKMATDWISDGLSRIGRLQVVSSATVFEIAHSSATAKVLSIKDPVKRLAAETGAGLVVSGSYYFQDDKIGVQARITDVTSDKLITAIEPVLGPKNAPMEAVGTVGQRIMGALAALSDKVFSVDSSVMPPTYQAYQEFLAGVELVGKDDAGAFKHWTRALELDPSFVTVRLRIISRSLVLWDYSEAAKHLAVLETQRERMSPIQRYQMAAQRAQLGGRYEEALLAFREAARLAPEDVNIAFSLAFYAALANHHREAVDIYTGPLDWKTYYERPGMRGFFYFLNLCESLHLLGEHERELAIAKQGQAAHPDVWNAWGLEVTSLAALGRLDEVERAIRDGIGMAPEGVARAYLLVSTAWELSVHGHHELSLKMAVRAADWCRSRPPDELKQEAMRCCFGYALYTAERWDEAQAIFEQLAEEFPKNIEYQGWIGVLAVKKGNREAALRISEDLRRISRPYLLGQNTFWRACIAAQLGEKDRAVELLRDALAEGVWPDFNLHQAPGLWPLLGYAPYADLKKPKG